MDKKVIGIFVLLIVVMALTSIIGDNFLSPINLMNIARWTGLFGFLTIGVAFVIITGGIDLSVGSIVGLIGTLLPMMLIKHGMPIWEALLLLLGLSVGIGLAHGLLITKLKLQPFVVTLCGLFVYRGMARWAANDATQGFGNEFIGLKYLAKGRVPSEGLIETLHLSGWLNNWALPMPFIFLILIAVLAAVFLNRTIYGRYLLALGRNETAARYSGINTDRMVIVAYIISAVMAGIAGVLFALDLNSVQPSGQGNFYELYAIAGAVLGGCSLRGGEGSIIGVLLGTAIVRVLYNAINILGIPTQLEFAVIGMVILIGVVADEVIRRLATNRRTALEARRNL
jgi:ribose transport system permease protein